MKKITALVLVLILFSIVFVGAETPPELKEGSFTYVTVPIIKVLEQRNYYVVYYQKFGTKLGCVSIPREWFMQGKANRKGLVKPLVKNCDPYISIFFKDGEFARLDLNVPSNKMHTMWGVFTGSVLPSEIDPQAFVHGL
ncbi:MAG: hypothetical protein KBT02_03115 [Treponema sp.]|nr:hypothetical protein [Candidatus Treponema caballi]